MIIDTSALIAVLQKEPERDDFLALIAASPASMISAGSWIEVGAVLARRGQDELSAIASRMLTTLEIQIAPVTPEQAQIGHEAYLRFGRNRHRAALNFGDCFAYALAKATGRPLLFKGDDFGHTDIASAL